MIQLSFVYGQNKTLLFLLLILCFAFFIFISEEFLISDNLYYEHYGSQLSFERIESLIKFRDQWKWVFYAILPLLYVLKFAILSTWILIGIIFFGYRVSFKKIFQVVIVAEFVFLLPAFIKIIWFGFIHTAYTLTDLSYFTPLSLTNLFDFSTLDPWWVYPLQSLNVFEIIYVLILAIGIKKIIKKDYGESLKFTVPVYGSGLLIWIIFITFLTLNFSS